MNQAILNAVLRTAGRVLPTAGGLDFRLIRRLHSALPQECTRPWTAGNGFLMGADTSNVTFISGVAEKAFLNLVVRQVARNGLVVNIGANIGYTTLFLAKALSDKGRDSSFLALEPEPQTFAMLERNIALNPYRIDAVCVAGGDADTTSEFYSTGNGDGAASLDPRMVDNAVTITVAVRRLDTVLAERSGDDVVGLVIDVEGHGGAVLRGSERTLLKHRPFVACEIHNSHERAELEACLTPLGYSIADHSNDIWGEHLIWRPSGSRAL